MKTIILYATKHGATCEIAQRIAGRLNDAITHDLKQGNVPLLTDFNCVIIGSSLYAGMIRKEAKEFLLQNANALRAKKLGLFLSGIDASREKEFINASFPSDILKTATATAFLGGIFDPKKAGVLERFIMKAVAKHGAYTETIDDTKIQQFVEALTA